MVKMRQGDDYKNDECRRRRMPKIGYHTDAFNSYFWSFEQCVDWAAAHGLEWIECGLIDGTAYIQALGYFPHVSMLEDPMIWRKTMDAKGVSFSQLDAAYPLSRRDGLTIGVQYIEKAIRWAALIGCPCVDTTDHKTLPEGMTDKEGLEVLRLAYGEILKTAEAHKIIINVEPHGYFTTNPVFMAEILNFYESEYLCMNMDTGNTFIAGQDPVAFVEQFKDRVSHVHIKDVSEELANALRGEATGIALSQCAIGAGVNADSIKACVGILLDHGYDGVFSMECDGTVLESSIDWFRTVCQK
jgi:inosose dehydratase